MYRKILVAYNGTPESKSALQECVRLAPGPSAEIHLLVVVNPPQSVVIGEYAMVSMVGIEDDLAAEKKKMEQELEEGLAYLQQSGLNVRKHLEIGEPVPTITHLVDTLGIELVIVGHSRLQSLAMRWWRGSTDTLLVEKIRCSLLVANDPERKTT
ncbi:MAG TPA: universal stress protein [Oxalicibacterium sp.]|uniref:universal stress protein n=1 Tax=Oxalicibacterium sp. TaxID=2766525 RepID=UPI002BF4ABBD|nr:universal stress protein [Oxalicibacterium sp.]HWU97952.1 universal stress protein [Oxalicibacterium sp.]